MSDQFIASSIAAGQSGEITEPQQSKLPKKILATVEKSAKSAPVQRHTKHIDSSQITPPADCLKLLLIKTHQPSTYIINIKSLYLLSSH